MEAFQIASADSLSEMNRQILDDWTEFRGGARIRDDLSLLLLQID
jgi:serine phosphatase RsbU (regulator of sigma subunit)